MKNKNWEAIHTTYMKLESFCGASLIRQDNTADSENEGGEGLVESDLIGVRSELRTQLDFLRATLAEQYSERDTYLILFPIVAQIDEHILNHFISKMQSGWPSLQRELFQIDNGGEVFYEILDDILRKPQTSQFIFEVYYFCLHYGFRGRYQDNPVKISTYLKSLGGKLVQEELVVMAHQAEAGGLVAHRGSRVMGYLASAGVMAFAYTSLLLAGRNLL